MARVLGGVAIGVMVSLGCGTEVQGQSAESEPSSNAPLADPTLGAARADVPAVAQPVGIPITSELPSLAPVIEKVVPAVVSIAVRAKSGAQPGNPLFNDPMFRRFFDFPMPPQDEVPRMASGSGVIVDAARGLILTNNHVVEEAAEITVTLMNGGEHKAKLIGTDPEADIAVLKIEATELIAVKPGNSDTLRVGDYVLAIGNPFGLRQTVTSGIVSALGRAGLNIENYEDFIQTDASINPGNSGGALINLRGELVGINTAIVSPGRGGNVGIGFAIPVNMAMRLMSDIVEFGEVRRGQLGVVIQPMTRELAEGLGIEFRKGALISQILPNTPAARAGLRVGDVVFSLNGKTIENANDLKNAVGFESAGAEVAIGYMRDGKQREMRVTLEQKTDITRTARAKQGGEPAGSVSHPALAGVTLRDVEASGEGTPAGVEVVGIEPSARGAQNFETGDVIVEVNRQPVSSVAELDKRLGKKGGAVLLVARKGRTYFLAIE
jgi:Do/DeqQ family serine protease